jgi:PAS domain S-box-containing protein
MFLGPMLVSDELAEDVFDDSKTEAILDAYRKKIKKQKRESILAGMVLLAVFLSTTVVMFGSEYQLDMVQVLFVAFTFSVCFTTILYFFLSRKTKNRLIKLIIHRLDQALNEKKNLEKIMLQLSVSVDNQIQERLKKINLEKSSAFRVMQEAIKSKRSHEISENSLKRMLNKLSLTLEASGIGLWNWDIKEDKFWFDDQMHKLFELGPKTFTGTLENFINLSKQKNSSIELVFDSAKSKGGFKNLEIEIKLDEHTWRQLILKGKTFYGLQDQPLYMTGVCWDITQEKETQETVNKFFSLSVDLFCVADSRGFFQDLSSDWASILGFTLNELKSHPFMYYVHPKDRKKTQAEFQILLSHPHRTVNFENRYKCKNGKYKDLLWNAVSIPEDNLVYAVARDITDYKNKIIKNSLEFIEDHRAAKIEFSI